MILVEVGELLAITLLILLGTTQIILPLWRGTPLFPFFRKERRLQQDLAEATENVVEAELENQIAKASKKAKTVRRKVHQQFNKTGEE